MELISCAEFADTGSLSTRSFHELFAGKTGQCGAAGSRSASADEPVRRTTMRAAAAAAAGIGSLMAFASAASFLILSAVATAPLRRVLIVDDDADIRLLLEELLRGAGYEVETAEDGRAAL